MCSSGMCDWLNKIKRNTFWNLLAQLIAPGQSSLAYRYKTEVKLSVANGDFDIKTKVTATVLIKSLGDCKYALQVRKS